MDLAEQVPELPTGDCSHNLPVQLTSFIGRAADMARVRGLLAQHRLVTLTGAGGGGKTRLAPQIAAGKKKQVSARGLPVDVAPPPVSAPAPGSVGRAPAAARRGGSPARP